MTATLARRLRDRAMRMILPLLLWPTRHEPWDRLGSDYGGWYVPSGLLTRHWICYLVGAGEDITFDLALHSRFRSEIVILDPTPRAVEHVRTHLPADPKLTFIATGVWHRDAVLRFFAPSDPKFVSHSVVNLRGTTEYFEAPCRSLRSIMDELGHTRIDLLKLDIEGAEHAVLRGMLADDIYPQVLLVEFDQPVPVRAVLRSVALLRQHGYCLAVIDRWNYCFLRGVSKA